MAEHSVTVLVRAGCHACEDAVRTAERICAELAVSWRVEDVDSDPELRAEYGDQVPVVLVDGVEHGFWRIEESRLRAALSA